MWIRERFIELQSEDSNAVPIRCTFSDHCSAPFDDEPSSGLMPLRFLYRDSYADHSTAVGVESPYKLSWQQSVSHSKPAPLYARQTVDSAHGIHAL